MMSMAVILEISKWAYEALSADDDVQALTGGRIFPVIAQQGSGTMSPTVVFRSVGASSTRTKDGTLPATCTLELSAMAADVMQVQALADAVAACLEEDTERDALLQSYSESFVVDYQVYEGVMTFSVEL